MTSDAFFGRIRCGMVAFCLALVVLFPHSAAAQARTIANSLGGPAGKSNSGSSSPTSTAPGSQAATAATAATAQAAQTAASATLARSSLMQSLASFQKLQQTVSANQAAAATTSAQLGLTQAGNAYNQLVQTQLAAHNAAVASTAPTLSTGTGGGTVTDGIGTAGLLPYSTTQGAGVIPPVSTNSPSIQVVDLGSTSGNNQLVLSKGGTVALPYGTTATDKVTLTGAGTVTSTSGPVSATAGSLTTTTGGTLAAANGGSISLTAGAATLTATTQATITSTGAGSYTSGGSTVAFGANQAVIVPAGATVNFTGSSAATVTVTGAATVKLSGAGTLALADATTGNGGTITTNSGATTFTNAVLTAQPAGTTIAFNGNGSIALSSTTGDTLPVIVEPVSTSANQPPSFTTTGNVLNTVSYNLSGYGWSGVQDLSQSTDGGKTTVTVTQNAQQALLYWQSFNIGKNTTLEFDQSAGGASVNDWVAINRILDPNLNPSDIFGAIEAPGQVYVINQNGIVFHGSSQVNTHALVASTLPINENLVTNGLLNNPDGEFLFTAQQDVNQGNVVYDPATDSFAEHGAASGNITVQEGAMLSSPGSAEGVGGRIALIAPQVENAGELSAPDGQIILAAGQQVGFDAHPSSDPSLRGLDVAVGAANGNETVTNDTTGLIDAPEADVTLTGPNLNQNGDIHSVTSVSLNGRIDLLAMSGLQPVSINNPLFGTPSTGNTTSAVGGNVVLGSTSITEITPDYASSDTQVGLHLALPSQIYVEGASFHMVSDGQGNAAKVIAPNATVTFGLGILNETIAGATGETTTPLPEDIGDGGNSGGAGSGNQPIALGSGEGSFTLDPNTVLDVSGSANVQASVTENIVSAQLTQAVLENATLQKSGPLRGQTVLVDISKTGVNPDGSTWYGSPVGDLSGYANLVEHTVGELTVDGGSVAINSNGSLQVGANATINVSGGSINYQGADVNTTKVLTTSGRVIDISDATANQVYAGIYDGQTITSAKWGVSQNFTGSLQSGATFDPGYIQGGNGGAVTLNASQFSLDGAATLYGTTVAGVRQQTKPPTAGSFNLNVIPEGSSQGDPPTVDIVIQPTHDSQTADPTAIYLSPDLFGADGFSNASIETGSGKLTIASDAVINASAGGSLNFTAANIDDYGQIYVLSGAISLTALPKTPIDIQQNNSTPYDPTIGNLNVYQGATLATTGLTFDEQSGTAPGTLPFEVNGGNISLSGAVTSLSLATPLASGASIIDASGGVARTAGGTTLSGKGGTITLHGFYNGLDGNSDGALVLGTAAISAYGVGKGSGGTLQLQAPAVILGNNGTAGAFPVSATPLVITDGGFFSQGGFSKFAVAGSAGVQILSDAQINPVLTEEVVDANGTSFGTSLISTAQLPSFPAAPVSLSFSANGFATSELSMADGATISTAAQGNITLNATRVDLNGTIRTADGSISVTAGNTAAIETLQPGTVVAPPVSIHLGATADLNVDGTVLTVPTQFGSTTYTVGQVLPGGNITLSGNIVGDAGATLSANGTGGTVAVPVSNTSAASQSVSLQQRVSPYVSETIASNGGAIQLNGDELLIYNGSVSAAGGTAGGLTGNGGALTIGSGLAQSYNQPPNAGYAEVFLQQDGSYAYTYNGLGSALGGVAQTGGGYFTVDQFSNGGFASLTVNGNVQFQATSDAPNVTINAAQQINLVSDTTDGTIFADGSGEKITLNAPYISIGASSINSGGDLVNGDAPDYIKVVGATATLPGSPVTGLADPTYGAASLTLNAQDLIDVGYLSLQNFGTTSFSAGRGDIRGGGLFYAAGQINLDAGQIYAPTAATFTVAAFGSDNSVNGGTIKITDNEGAASSLPLSAGSTLNIYATNIEQDGVLEAPFGVINLGALPDATTGQTPELPGISFALNNLNQYVANPDTTQTAPVTTSLALGGGSVTSVSGVSGSQVLELPYGTIQNGNQWIAPNGADITAGGLPNKAVNLRATSINDQTGALVDLNGGGDLFAYQFNPGIGGTNDILSLYKYSNGSIVENSSSVPVNSTSFAIVPSYSLDYAPIDLTRANDGTTPYANSTLTGAKSVGDQIYLAGGNGIAAGDYTILPARYALITGAYLVNETGANATPTSLNPDGSINMAGYTVNTLNANQQVVPTYSDFELDPNSVINARAPYTLSSANSFLKTGAISNSQPVPRLPVDAGVLSIDAGSQLALTGTLAGQGAVNGSQTGLNSLVDIATSQAIYIVGNSSDLPTLVPPPGGYASSSSYLTLSAQELDAFGADSLLIGGLRSSTSGDAVIDPLTSNIYVQNSASTALTGNEVMLVSQHGITLSSGASIEGTAGAVSTTRQNLTLGSSTTLGSGDGTFLRVTDDGNATFTRAGVNSNNAAPTLTIGTNATVQGTSVTLDSSSGASIDPTASVFGPGPASTKTPSTGYSLTLDAGQVSLQVDPTVSVASAPGLVITNASTGGVPDATSVGSLFTTTSSPSALSSLTLFSYSNINLYGAGTLGGVDGTGTPILKSLTLSGAGVVGQGVGAGQVSIDAQTVSLNNPGQYTISGAAPTPTAGSELAIHAGTVKLGGNTFAVDGYDTLQLTATSGVLANGSGQLDAQQNLGISASEVTGVTSANYTFNAQGGDLNLTKPTGTAGVTGGIAATLSFDGNNVNLGSTVSALAGVINANAASGVVDIQSGADLMAGGEKVAFGSSGSYLNGGAINLTSATGNVQIDAGSTVDVSAVAGGGNAGALTIKANQGVTIADNTLNGTAGTSGTAGSINVTVGTEPSLSALTTPATHGGFTSQTYDVLTGAVTVDGPVGATTGNGLALFSLTSEDASGGITVNSAINATGVNGGAIDLYADGGITLNSAAVLSVTGQQLNNAGEGGSIDIETRGANGGVLDVGQGQLVLGVGTGSSITAAGTVHLRAPVNASGAVTSIAIDPLTPANISNPGSVVIEGYRTFTPSNGVVTLGAGTVGTTENSVDTFVENFPVASLATELGFSDGAVYHIEPGAEIVNPSGNLTLGTSVRLGTASTYWDLSGVRTSDGNPGILTFRAAGNLIFNGSLTDGFANNSSDPSGENVSTAPYTWDLLTNGESSWSYRLVAGADFNSTTGDSTANYGTLAPGSGGSLDLGLNMPVPRNNNYGSSTAAYADTYAQLIRTGNGNITIDTSGDVDLLNQLATIYTAGQVDSTPLAGFDTPSINNDTNYDTRTYGAPIAPAPQYTPQYTENGGDVTINAGGNIQHLTLSNGQLVADTSWQFPTNWLNRRGATTASGAFDTNRLNSGEVSSTTWWVDFSNFFEGVGALGGGNVALNAGGNIVNVDAVVPTNGRVQYTNDQLTELGGGNLTVVAGGNIEGGDYYVQRGTGLIQGNTIASQDTNANINDTARIDLVDANLGNEVPVSINLFLGDNSTISVNATNDVNVGTLANPFLLPQGIGNGFGDKSVFSTYGDQATVNVSSLFGTITMQGSESTSGQQPGSLYNAYQANGSKAGLTTSSARQVQSDNGTPWTLTLDQSNLGRNNIGYDSISGYQSFFDYSPPVFNATAYSGNIQFLSDLTLAPSQEGTMRLLASGQVEGAYNSATYGSGQTTLISILDNDPSKFPGITNPLGLGATTQDTKNNPAIQNGITTVEATISQGPTYENQTFNQLQGQHTDGLLHTDPNTPPVQILTSNGNIDDLTLISPEKTDVSAGGNLQDDSFYLQNNSASDISVISANGNITLFDPISAGLIAPSVNAPNSPFETFGDAQLSGPGALEILAGGSLNLGQGTTSDALSNPGTNLGVDTIGNARDPYLPFIGAQVIAAAGLGPTSGLSTNPTRVNYQAFENAYLNPSEAPTAETSVYLPDLAALMGVTGETNAQVWSTFEGKDAESQAALATTIFYDVLRDAGRNHNDPTSSSFGSYTPGYAAISTLFPSSNTYSGDISLTSREFKTSSGGDINLLTPGGGIEVGQNNQGAQAVDQGILTVDGGNISIYTNNNVDIGTSRIFTLHGGNVIIWSSTGNIDAGASSRTVQSAPPTRVLVDSQSANVQTDLAGLATGGGIGVLETVVGAPPGNVDLIAPEGIVNAGDAGIRSSGNINIAASQVLNAGNIQAGGLKTGVSSGSAPNVGASLAGAATAGSSQNAATNGSQNQGGNTNNPQNDLPSIISVDVIGLGSGDDSASTEEPSDRKRVNGPALTTGTAPVRTARL
jgi:filamentous hemagglutinin family protein